jgi:phosphate-selective porin OprO and OprP
MRRKYGLAYTALLGTALSATGSVAVMAQTPDITAQLKAQQQQIQELQRQLQSMQKQVKADKPSTPPMLPAKAAAIAAAAPKVVQTPTNRFFLSSADGLNTIGLTGRLNLDAGDYVSVRPGTKGFGPSDLSNGFNARRARIGVTGKVDGVWGYTFIYDAGNSQDNTPKGIQTAQIAYNGFKKTAIEFGYSDTFFSLDEATSSNDIMFMERATPGAIATSLAAGDFRSNAGFRTWDDRYWIGAYVTGPAQGQLHSLSSENFGALQRATYQVLQGPDYSLHLGVGVSELFQAGNAGLGTPNTVTLSDPPELRIDNTALLNTGAIGSITNPVTGGAVYNVETAAGYRSLFFQGEYFHYAIDRTGLKQANFDGGYGELSWTLTGEARQYNPSTGAYNGIIPFHAFTNGESGWGAWEVAARVSYVNLVDNLLVGQSLASQPSAINGGKQTNVTVGLNWYVNSNMRFMLNYVHGEFDKSNSTAVAGAPLGTQIGTNFDALAMRAQVAF